MLPQRWRFVVYNDCGVQLDFSANSANEKGWAMIRRTIVNPADGKTDCHGDDTSGTKHNATSDLADGAVLALTAMSQDHTDLAGQFHIETDNAGADGLVILGFEVDTGDGNYPSDDTDWDPEKDMQMVAIITLAGADSITTDFML